MLCLFLLLLYSPHPFNKYFVSTIICTSAHNYYSVANVTLSFPN